MNDRSEKVVEISAEENISGKGTEYFVSISLGSNLIFALRVFALLGLSCR